MANCQGCGTALVWAVNPKTSKRVPVHVMSADEIDAQKYKHPRTVVYRVAQAGSLTTCTPVDAWHGEGKFGVNHFQTCPKADSFNRGKK